MFSVLLLVTSGHSDGWDTQISTVCEWRKIWKKCAFWHLQHNIQHETCYIKKPLQKKQSVRFLGKTKKKLLIDCSTHTETYLLFALGYIEAFKNCVRATACLIVERSFPASWWWKISTNICDQTNTRNIPLKPTYKKNEAYQPLIHCGVITSARYMTDLIRSCNECWLIRFLSMY